MKNVFVLVVFVSSTSEPLKQKTPGFAHEIPYQTHGFARENYCSFHFMTHLPIMLLFYLIDIRVGLNVMGSGKDKKSNDEAGYCIPSKHA